MERIKDRHIVRKKGKKGTEIRLFGSETSENDEITTLSNVGEGVIDSSRIPESIDERTTIRVITVHVESSDVIRLLTWQNIRWSSDDSSRSKSITTSWWNRNTEN
ncbi:hypothetical protein GCK72_006250 [Caenorhabditis remanei]|uniref:Uncharacterized protein n=1 Tax=Caenorhabditis remanei TaxID=31234 RepID=A0A6A5HI29_CAERE|nr:hypothetical protein GCK72_006250 [Caenorhabditis remanei]KAF1766294.1 hypothetical protein GCK72_006250 [Caenorhabditis remanei]